MGIKVYKPTSPGRRGMTGSTFEEITKTKPEQAERLIQLAQQDVSARWKLYQQMAAMQVDGEGEGKGE